MSKNTSPLIFMQRAGTIALLALTPAAQVAARVLRVTGSSSLMATPTARQTTTFASPTITPMPAMQSAPNPLLPTYAELKNRFANNPANSPYLDHQAPSPSASFNQAPSFANYKFVGNERLDETHKIIKALATEFADIIPFVQKMLRSSEISEDLRAEINAKPKRFKEFTERLTIDITKNQRSDDPSLAKQKTLDGMVKRSNKIQAIAAMPSIISDLASKYPNIPLAKVFAMNEKGVFEQPSEALLNELTKHRTQFDGLIGELNLRLEPGDPDNLATQLALKKMSGGALNIKGAITAKTKEIIQPLLSKFPKPYSKEELAKANEEEAKAFKRNDALESIIHPDYVDQIYHEWMSAMKEIAPNLPLDDIFPEHDKNPYTHNIITQKAHNSAKMMAALEGNEEELANLIAALKAVFKENANQADGVPKYTKRTKAILDKKIIILQNILKEVENSRVITIRLKAMGYMANN